MLYEPNPILLLAASAPIILVGASVAYEISDWLKSEWKEFLNWKRFGK